MANLETLVEQLSELTVLEAAELSKLLEKRWGVSATQQAPVAVATVAPVEVVEEQTEFSVVLAAVDAARKINVIKEVRAITGLGLKEAKEFTETAGPGKIIKENLSKAEAEALVKRLEESGAVAALA